MLKKYMAAVAIPLIGLAGLYIISNSKKRMGYTNPTREQVPLENTSTKRVSFVDVAGREMNTEEYTKTMVPYFGKTKTIGTSLTNFQHAEHELDNMAGDGTHQIRKTENAPLFKPEETYEYPYGMPNNNNFIQERMIVGNKMNNVKPFQEKQVAPGINQGYTTEGSGGFNSGTEFRNLWIDKTVDELRVLTKPKESFMLTNHEGPAQNIVKNLGIQPKVEKHLPDKYYVNTPDRYLVTTGNEIAPAVRSIQPEVLGTRTETTTEYGGIASRTGPEAPAKHGMYKIDSRQQLGSLPVNPSQHSVSQNNLGNVRPQVLPTNRAFTYESYGGLGSLVSAITAPIKDMIRPTRKEELIDMPRTGNIGSFIPNAPIPDMIVPSTIKENTVYSPLEMGARPFTNVVEGGYQLAEQPLSITERDTTSTFYSGNPGGSHQRVYDTYYTPSSDKTVIGREPIGNAKMFTPMINQTTSSGRSDMHTSYVGAAQTANQMMGPEQYKQTRTVVSYDEPSRNETSLLDAFKQNPYTHSLQSAV
jgi:hypothetical protein